MRCPVAGCVREGTRLVRISQGGADMFTAPASVPRGDEFVLCNEHAAEMGGPSPEALRQSLAQQRDEAHAARVAAAAALAGGTE